MLTSLFTLLELRKLINHGSINSLSASQELLKLAMFGSAFVRGFDLFMYNNLIKLAISTITFAIFIYRTTNTNKRRRVSFALALVVLLIGGSFLVLLFKCPSKYRRTRILGPIVIVLYVLTGGLLPLPDVIRGFIEQTKEGIPFLKTMSSLASNGCWLICGYGMPDPFIVVMYIVPFAVCALLMIQYAVYPHPPPPPPMVAISAEELEDIPPPPPPQEPNYRRRRSSSWS